MKRSKKSTIPQKTKKYNYYASNFDQQKEEFSDLANSKSKNTSNSVVRKTSHTHFQTAKSPQKHVPRSEISDGEDSIEEFEKLEEECIKQTNLSKYDLPYTPPANSMKAKEVETKPSQSAMEMIIKKENDQKWHNKRKLFDDSESDDQDDDDMAQAAPKTKENVDGMINRIINKPKEIKPAPKIVETIPAAITEILDK